MKESAFGHSSVFSAIVGGALEAECTLQVCLTQGRGSGVLLPLAQSPHVPAAPGRPLEKS
jgi:hypothetical protein